jgi:hypothetical protein
MSGLISLALQRCPRKTAYDDSTQEAKNGQPHHHRATEPKAQPLATIAGSVHVDTDAEEEARDAALIASLAGSVDDARRLLKADDHLLPAPLLRDAVAPYLAAAPAHDAALRAFFASSEKKEDHVPTIGLWALARVPGARAESGARTRSAC